MRHNISYRTTRFNIPEPEIRSQIAHLQREFGGFQSKGYHQERIGGVFMPPQDVKMELLDDLETFATGHIRPKYIPKGIYSVGELRAMESDDFYHFASGIVHPDTYKGRLIRLSNNEVLDFCVGGLMSGNIDWRESKAVGR